MAAEVSSEIAFESFLRDFEIAAIPAGEWTHASHVAMAGGYLQRMGTVEAMEKVRTGIQHFSTAHGGVTTRERGYHESLTRLWVYVCDAFLQESGLRGVEAIRALITVFGRRSDLHRDYYSYDVVRSDARYQWWAPDSKALPAAWRRENVLISTNAKLLHLATIHEFIRHSYWAEGIPREILERSVRNSLPFGIYEEGKQIGFCRVVTDYATYGWVMDVVIDEKHRGRGLSKWMMECVLCHPSLQGFRRWGLGTRDAHGLYERFGFQTVRNPQLLMELIKVNPYQAV